MVSLDVKGWGAQNPRIPASSNGEIEMGEADENGAPELWPWRDDRDGNREQSFLSFVN